MTNDARRNPFRVGEQYRNEDGDYTVLQIEEPDMVIQYDDGRTLRSSIRLQARIWERIRDEEAMAEEMAEAKKAARRRGGSRSRASLGRDFHGLQETDFRSELAGTTWRRRSELAGLLAARLTDLCGQLFESHAVYRRPEVYIVQPQHWNPKESQKAAKFFFLLSEQEAWYGFYIEKSDKPMDQSWDWAGFMAALGEDKGLQARTIIAMEHCDLRWVIHPGGATVTEPAPYYVTAEQDTLYLQAQEGGERSPIDWDGFLDLLAAVPDDQWCDCYLATSMEKPRAVELGVGLAGEAANAYHALLPLYAASVHR
jgi:hypothetical protein